MEMGVPSADETDALIEREQAERERRRDLGKQWLEVLPLSLQADFSVGPGGEPQQIGDSKEARLALLKEKLAGVPRPKSEAAEEPAPEGELSYEREAEEPVEESASQERPRKQKRKKR